MDAMDTEEEWTNHRDTVDPETRAYISSLVTAVGGTSIEEHGKYVLGDDAVGCLQDLRRWNRFYEQKLDKRLDVQRVLAESNFLKGDILEILAGWQETTADDLLKSKVMLLCLELLVPLTWAIEIDEDRFAVHHHQHLPYVRLAQVGYKRAILKHDSNKILRQIVRIGLPSMAEPRKERSARDEAIINLMLYAFRNVAQISQPLDLPADGDEVEISRSTTVEAFHYQDVFQLLLTVASSMGDEFEIQDTVILEVLFHVLKGIDPTQLFMKDEQLAETNTNELRELMRKEKAMKAGYARNAPTRHNRFGTMVWLKRDDERVSTISGQTGIRGGIKGLEHMDKTKKWTKPKHRSRNDEEKGSSEFDIAVPLTASARRHLRRFVEDFLDTSFNPLFTHLRKSIEREVDRVVDVNRMQFFYLISWFLEAECARRAQVKESAAKNGKQKEGAEAQSDEESFAIIAGVMNQETFVLLNRHMQRTQDTSAWNDLNAIMKCFTQILLTVQQMAESPNEDDQEIAENIQNRIFYEEATHDRVLGILRNYKDQGFGYLDSCTELAHVFVRMLERYSKQNSDLTIRSKRRRKKKKDQEANRGDDDSGAELERQAVMISKERKFDFTRFSARFMTQGCVDTFVSFTKYYRDLSQEQLKRCHRFFYREAFKADLSTILFRVDIMHLFYNMIKGQESMDHELPCFNEWEELVRQLFRRLTKRLKERPELMVEMLFSKIPSTLFYLEHGYLQEVTKSAPRPPAELEITPDLSPIQGIGVVTSLLILETKFELVSWVGNVLEKAIEERKAWEAADEARKAATLNSSIEIDSPGSPKAVDSEELSPTNARNQDDMPKAPIIFIKPENADVKTQMFKNNKLRLLMTLVGFERLDEDVPAATWIVPSSLSASDLEPKLHQVQRAEMGEDPIEYDDTHPGPADCVRRKNTRKAQSPRRTTALQSDSEGNESIDDDLLFPDNLPDSQRSKPRKDPSKKRRKRLRNASELGDEEKAKRLKARKDADLQKRSKIKSALYVHDSDDATDEERDSLFFAKEEQLRKAAGNATSKTIGGTKPVSKKRKKSVGDDTNKPTNKRRKSVESEAPSDMEGLDQDIVEISSDASSESDDEPHLNTDGDSEKADEGTDTPVSSQLQATSPKILDTSFDKASQTAEDVSMTDAGDDKDQPVQKEALRRNIRAGFIINDSDSE